MEPFTTHYLPMYIGFKHLVIPKKKKLQEQEHASTA